MVTIVPRVSDLYDRDNLCDHLNRHAIYFFLSAIHFAYLICNSFRRELRIFYISFFLLFFHDCRLTCVDLLSPSRDKHGNFSL